MECFVFGKTTALQLFAVLNPLSVVEPSVNTTISSRENIVMTLINKHLIILKFKNHISIHRKNLRTH